MTMLSRHASIRLRAALTNPFGLALLLFSALVTIIFWPGLTDASGAGWPGGQIDSPRGVVISITTVLLWLVMWPMIATSPLRGRVANGRRSLVFAAQAHPALPIGARSRVVAEAFTVLTVVMIVRAPVLLFDTFGEAQQILLRGADYAIPWRESFVEQSLAGSLIMLPFLLVSARAASSIEAYWLRLGALAALLFVAMKLGWLASLPACAATCLTLAAVVLVLPGRARSRISWPRALVRAMPRHRAARHPEVQFRRDLWLRPLPVAAGLLGSEVVFIILDRTIELPELVFYFASVLVFSWLLAFVPLQPMRSKMTMAGIFCKPGFQPGDFISAWSVLPLRRRFIVRSVFLYGLLSTAAVYLVVIGVICLSAWFEAGVFALVDSDGDPLGRLLIPAAAFVPAMAGLLTCASLGDRRGALIIGALLLLLPQIGLLLLIFKASDLLVVALTVGAAVVAPLPALKHLRADAAG